MKKLIVIMGVSGCGKTTVGKQLADEIGYEFHDGDDFHPEENVAMMKSGTPLTDEHRWPWLQSICEFARGKVADGVGVVVACSALKLSYRDRIRKGADEVRFVFLDGTHATILERLKNREHFFPPELLQTQFDDLETPTDEPDVLTVQIDQPATDIVNWTAERIIK